jgi:hypothetical protein
MPDKKAPTTATPPKKNKKSVDDGDKEQAAPKKAPSLKDIRALAKEKPAAAPKRKHPIPEDESDEFGVDDDSAVKEDSNATDTDDDTKATKAKDKKSKSPASKKKDEEEDADEEKPVEKPAKKKEKPQAAKKKPDDEDDEKPAKKKSKTEDGKAKPVAKASAAPKPAVKKPKKSAKEDGDAADADSNGKLDDDDDSANSEPSGTYCEPYSKYFAECLSRFAKGPKKVTKLFPFGVITFVSKGEKHVLRVLFDPENPKRGFVGFVDFLSGFLLKGVEGASAAEVKLLQETPDVYNEHVVCALAPNGYGEFAMNTFLSLESALLFGLTPGSKIRRKQFAQEVWDALAGAAWAVQLYDSKTDNDKLFEKYKVVACAHILGDGALVAAVIKSGESAKQYVDGLPYSVSNAFRPERKLSEKPASKSVTEEKKKPVETKQSDAKTPSAPKKTADAPKPDEKKKAKAPENVKPPLVKVHTSALASVKEEDSASNSTAPEVKPKAAKAMNASNGVASSPIKPKPAVRSNGHDSANDEKKKTEAVVPADPIVEDGTPVVADAPAEAVAADGGDLDIPCADGDAEAANGEPTKEDGERVATDNAPEMVESTDDNASQV